jgi:hypothetical protein
MITRIKKALAPLAVASAVAMAAVIPALADTPLNTTVSASTTTVRGQISITKAIARGDQEITRRITALTDLNTRIQAMVKVSATEKAKFSASIQSQINMLTILKAKIDGDTDATVLKADVKSITDSYRIFMLIMPQGRLMAASDRAETLVGLMNTLGAKLQVSITSAVSAGKNVSAAQTAYTDFTAKVSDANTQATNATAVIATLVPDNGNATVAASNKAALMASRADIKTATTDLQAARKDVTTIIKTLNSAGVTASSTVSL